jgi:hypothetical protein
MGHPGGASETKAPQQAPVVEQAEYPCAPCAEVRRLTRVVTFFLPFNIILW